VTWAAAAPGGLQGSRTYWSWSDVLLGRVAVSFVKKPRPFDAPRSRLEPVALSALVRTILLGALVVVLAAWALVRNYSRALPPTRIPTPPTAVPTYDMDAEEIPVPETIEPDGS
jgi:hypothetical protein